MHEIGSWFSGLQQHTSAIESLLNGLIINTQLCQMAGTKANVSEKGIFHCILNLYIKITMQHPTGFPSNKIYISF